MRWDELTERVIALQRESIESPVPWPEDLVPEIKVAWQKHEAFVFECLISTLTVPVISDAERARRLTHFLLIRNALTRDDSADYTVLHSPANSACLSVAVFLKKPDETACDILMPHVRCVLDPTEDNFKAACENSEGDFSPMDFLSVENGHALLPPRTFFEIVKADPDKLFSEKAFFKLNAEDYANLRRIVSDNKSVVFLDLLEKCYRMREGYKPSVGFALSTMQQALISSSKAGDGTETEAAILLIQEASDKKLAALNEFFIQSNNRRFALLSWREVLQTFGPNFFEMLSHYRVVFRSQVVLSSETVSQLLVRPRYSFLRGLPVPGSMTTGESAIFSAALD